MLLVPPEMTAQTDGVVVRTTADSGRGTLSLVVETAANRAGPIVGDILTTA